MKRTTMTAVLLLALGVAGCSGGDADEPSPTSSAVQTSSSSGGPEAALLAALQSVDPSLNDERSIDRAKNVCLDIEQGKDDATVKANAKARFSGAVELTDEQADGVLDAIDASGICE